MARIDRNVQSFVPSVPELYQYTNRYHLGSVPPLASILPSSVVARHRIAPRWPVKVSVSVYRFFSDDGIVESRQCDFVFKHSSSERNETESDSVANDVLQHNGVMTSSLPGSPKTRLCWHCTAATALFFCSLDLHPSASTLRLFVFSRLLFVLTQLRIVGDSL